MIYLLGILLSLILSLNSFAIELPALHAGINDLAGMFPPASADDLNERLRRFNTETAATIVVLTVKSLDGEDMQNFSRNAFKALPFDNTALAKSALLVVARKEHVVGLQTAAELRQLLPEPASSQKL